MAVKAVVSNFMECSSLNALPFIVNAENKAIKLFWILIFCAGTGAMLFHLFYVLHTYLEYETSTSITFQSSNLTFPDVFICTKSTIRRSKIEELKGKRIKEFLKEFDNANISSGIPIESIVNVTNPLGEEGTSWSQNVRSQLRVLYGAERRSIREAVGHQIKDMLLSCEYNDRKCSVDDFVLQNTMDYGNCFFFNPKRRIINTPGSDNGLHVKLYLEGNEFIPYLSQYGLQVLISAPNAIKFPSDFGIYASSNFETRIALSQNQITRLDGNYGPCNSSSTSLGKKEKKIYTKYGCTMLCEISYGEEQCGCVTPEDTDYAILQKDEQEITVCNISKTLCVDDAKQSIRNGSVTHCSDLCGEPCNETTYSLTPSTQIWPDLYTTESLINFLCRDNSSGCDTLKQQDYLLKRNNFAALTIFYDQMKYTSYSTSESYGIVSFASDFGGTMGLWIGISAITIVEILYFMFRLMYATMKTLCCRSESKKVNVELK